MDHTELFEANVKPSKTSADNGSAKLICKHIDSTIRSTPFSTSSGLIYHLTMISSNRI